MHYYKRNLGDYAKKAGRLSMLQHGSYTLLIDACYDREQFPTLEEAIEWTWASTTEEMEAVAFVLRKFFTLENGIYIQKRIQEEIAEYHGKAETNKRIAIDRETKRKENNTNREQENTNREQVVNESPPNHKPITNNHKPLTNIKTKPPREIALDDGFNEFWNIYPKKVGKTDAQKKWVSKKPNIDFVLQALRWQMPSEQWNKENGAFIPNPSTYINQERWNDEQPKLRAVF